MLKFLKKFKDMNKNSPIASEDDKNILVTSLLIECAREDGNFSEEEISKIRNLLTTKLNVNNDKINTIFDGALKMSQKSVEIYSITRDIRDNFSHDEILKILEYMWIVMLADGHIDDFESALMRKMVGLFHLTGKDSSLAKENAQKFINIQNQ